MFLLQEAIKEKKEGLD